MSGPPDAMDVVDQPAYEAAFRYFADRYGCASDAGDPASGDRAPRLELRRSDAGHYGFELVDRYACDGCRMDFDYLVEQFGPVMAHPRDPNAHRDALQYFVANFGTCGSRDDDPEACDECRAQLEVLIERIRPAFRPAALP